MSELTMYRGSAALNAPLFTPDCLLFRLVPKHVNKCTYECGPFVHKDGSPWVPMSTKSAPHVAPFQSGVRLLRGLPPEVTLDPQGTFTILAIPPKTPIPKGFVLLPMTENNLLLTWAGPGLLELQDDAHGRNILGCFSNKLFCR